MPKSTNLVEVMPKIIESTASVIEEDKQVETMVQETLAQQVASLEASVQTLEARLRQVEQKAHTEHDFALGPPEIAAIGNALVPQFKQAIVDHLKEHLGFAPPPVRGDAG